MTAGLDNLKHIVVLMMENRSFDHMLGSLKAIDPRIDGVTDQMSNSDTTGAAVKPEPLADFRGSSTLTPTTIFQRWTCKFSTETRAQEEPRICKGS